MDQKEEQIQSKDEERKIQSNNGNDSQTKEIKEVKLVYSFEYQSKELVWSKCAYFSDKEFAIGLESGEVILIDVESKESKIIPMDQNPQENVKDILFLQKNSIMITCYFYQNMCVWDYKNGCQFIKKLPYSSFNCAAIQDRYIALPSTLATILFLDSKKDFQVTQKVQLPITYLSYNLNSVRFITSFSPCSYLICFIDERHLYTFNFVTQKVIYRLKLQQYGVPCRVKTFKNKHFYYVLMLFTSNKVAVIDLINQNIIYSRKMREFSDDDSIQCCEFITSSSFFVGLNNKYAFIINFITKEMKTIQSKNGFVGAFSFKNHLATTADKNNQIEVYEFN